jgi:hypothetical protein
MKRRHKKSERGIGENRDRGKHFTVSEEVLFYRSLLFRRRVQCQGMQKEFVYIYYKLIRPQPGDQDGDNTS